MGECACGCGTPVAPGKQWVRGHNMRVMSGPAPSRAADPGPPPDDGDDGRWWVNDVPYTPPFTYDEAADTTPDDADPARFPGASPPADAIRITAAVRRDIEGKLAFWLSMGIDMWQMLDPYCAGVAADNVDKVSRKAAPLICQSPDLVRWFSRANGFMLWTELGMSVKPIIAAVIAHHVTKSVTEIRTADGKTATQKADWSAYTAA
jgi:hypothetical protein